MRRTAFRLLAASSVLWCAAGAAAAARPHYGGTLRVEMRAAPVSLDPTQEGAAPEAAARMKLAPLLFDTLFTLDASGRLRLYLASSATVAPDGKSWRITLPAGVRFQDGTPLTPQVVAGSLRAANSDWTVRAEADAVVIESKAPMPWLPIELARPRYAVVRRSVDGSVSGTGPFRIAEWVPGKKLVLVANDEYWQGRPLLDKISVELGRGLREQSIALELGKADMVEIAPDQARRALEERRHVALSTPLELVALVFDRNRRAAGDERLRQILAKAVDREAVRNVLLQRTGEATGSLLPNWITGYSFLFSTQADLARARQLRAELRQPTPLTLAYSAKDSLLRMIAERVALNAREAGLLVQSVAGDGPADIRLVRSRLASPDPMVALMAMAEALGFAAPRGADPEQLYRAEREVVDSAWVMPLVYLPETYGISPRVRDWNLGAGGSWKLEDVWVEGQP